MENNNNPVVIIICNKTCRNVVYQVFVTLILITNKMHEALKTKRLLKNKYGNAVNSLSYPYFL